MKVIFNSINFLRTKLSGQSLAVNKRKFIDMNRSYVGLARGYWSSIIGRVFYENDYRPLIIGGNVDYDIWPGGSIILTGENDYEKIIDPFDRIFPTASSIGVKPPFDHMNPASWSLTRIRIREGAKLVLEPNTSILTGCYIAVGPGNTIRIGSETRISQRVMLNSICGLNIGKNVSIAQGVKIMDYDGHPIFALNKSEESTNKYAGNAKSITINDNVLIGFNATVLKGVTIGEGAIVAANACVTSDIPSNTMVAGNPAKIIKEGISWRRY